ncbi:MAG: PKD domain-containing protein, partial [Bdellovibrionota bacterium]
VSNSSSAGGMSFDFGISAQLKVDLCQNGVKDEGEQGVDCGGTCRPCEWPQVTLTADPPKGYAPFSARLTAQATDPDGRIISYFWNYDDGSSGFGTESLSHTFNQVGIYQVVVIVTDNDGFTAEAKLEIQVLSKPKVQLNIYNRETGLWEELFDPYDLFNPANPTTVIVHGWNPADVVPSHWDGDLNANSKEEAHWTRQMAQSISLKHGHKINILGWDWIEEATASLPPGHKVKNQATLLSDALIQVFKAKNYSKTQPVHLIGHSLGAHIIAYSGIHLIESFHGGYRISQITLFDPPENWLAEFIANISEPINEIRANSKKLIGIDTYVELYDGFFNSGNHGAHLFVDVPYEEFPGHSVDEWYLPTVMTDPIIKDENGNEIPNKTVGYGTTIIAKRPDPTCESYCEIETQKTVSVQYVNWQFGGGYFKQENECGNCEVYGPESTIPLFINDVEITGDGKGIVEENSFRFWIDNSNQGKKKAPGYEATCQFPVAINDWDYVSFDFGFMTNTENVFLTFSIITDTETLTVLKVGPTTLLPQGTTGLLPLSHLRGQNVRFIFTLNSFDVGDQAVVTNLSLSQDFSHSNLTPQANAGPDAMYETGINGITNVTLSGVDSVDPEGGHLWHAWFEGENYVDDGSEIVIQLTPGIYAFTLRVADEFGAFAIDDVIITVTGTSQGAQFIRGDANRDGNLDIADPIKILSYLFASDEATCLDACDVNDSGQVDI